MRNRDWSGFRAGAWVCGRPSVHMRVSRRKPSGVFRHNTAGANKALELLGRAQGMFQERRSGKREWEVDLPDLDAMSGYQLIGWMAGGARAWHFQWFSDEKKWFAKAEQEEFFQLLNQLIDDRIQKK